MFTKEEKKNPKKAVLRSLADRLQKMKTVLMTLILIDIAVDMGLNYIPSPAITSASTSLLYLQNATYLVQYRKEHNLNFSSNGKDYILSYNPWLFDGAFYDKEENIS
ncbi:hypothetical protein TNIN_234341 [Trichonephila inaurata madagascariensis]|uniref:Uncharacterized protein n=1 Tax=Trichonephila inaurata madagascariensis TaxID=2747483 RepID=A0A8X6XA77_9ARAC|nr:hypothetical protein TNIN_234341 [Trichonephila inaurata madagascariensis]